MGPGVYLHGFVKRTYLTGTLAAIREANVRARSVQTYQHESDIAFWDFCGSWELSDSTPYARGKIEPIQDMSGRPFSVSSAKSLVS